MRSTRPDADLALRLRPEADRNHFVLLHEVAAQVFKPLNLGFHDDRIDDSFRVVAALFPLEPSRRFALAGPLQLRFANQFAEMLRGARFARAQHDIRIGLAQNGLGFLSVNRIELAHPLKSQNNRIVGLALLRHGAVKLWQCV